MRSTWSHWADATRFERFLHQQNKKADVWRAHRLRRTVLHCWWVRGVQSLFTARHSAFLLRRAMLAWHKVAVQYAQETRNVAQTVAKHRARLLRSCAARWRDAASKKAAFHTRYVETVLMEKARPMFYYASVTWLAATIMLGPAADNRSNAEAKWIDAKRCSVGCFMQWKLWTRWCRAMRRLAPTRVVRDRLSPFLDLYHPYPGVRGLDPTQKTQLCTALAVSLSGPNTAPPSASSRDHHEAALSVVDSFLSSVLDEGRSWLVTPVVVGELDQQGSARRGLVATLLTSLLGGAAQRMLDDENEHSVGTRRGQSQAHDEQESSSDGTDDDNTLTMNPSSSAPPLQFDWQSFGEQRTTEPPVVSRMTLLHLQRAEEMKRLSRLECRLAAVHLSQCAHSAFSSTAGGFVMDLRQMFAKKRRRRRRKASSAAASPVSTSQPPPTAPLLLPDDDAPSKPIPLSSRLHTTMDVGKGISSSSSLPIFAGEHVIAVSTHLLPGSVKEPLPPEDGGEMVGLLDVESTIVIATTTSSPLMPPLEDVAVYAVTSPPLGETDNNDAVPEATSSAANDAKEEVESFFVFEAASSSSPTHDESYDSAALLLVTDGAAVALDDEGEDEEDDCAGSPPSPRSMAVTSTAAASVQVPFSALGHAQSERGHHQEDPDCELRLSGVSVFPWQRSSSQAEAQPAAASGRTQQEDRHRAMWLYGPAQRALPEHSCGLPGRSFRTHVPNQRGAYRSK